MPMIFILSYTIFKSNDNHEEKALKATGGTQDAVAPASGFNR